MKNFVFGLFLALPLFSHAAESEAGRFQLFQGYYEPTATIDGETGNTQKKAIMKIDTTSGNVWVYTEVLVVDKKSKYIGESKRWVLIDGKATEIRGTADPN